MASFPIRLPDGAWLHRHRAKFAGFLAGAALQLVLAGLVQTVFTGGLSDQFVPRPSVYDLY
jgi:hypothetical protein